MLTWVLTLPLPLILSPLQLDQSQPFPVCDWISQITNIPSLRHHHFHVPSEYFVLTTQTSLETLEVRHETILISWENSLVTWCNEGDQAEQNTISSLEFLGFRSGSQENQAVSLILRNEAEPAAVSKSRLCWSQKHKLNNYRLVHISVRTRKVCQTFSIEILIVFRLGTLAFLEFFLLVVVFNRGNLNWNLNLLYKLNEPNNFM